jgi:hypothetical protein
MVILILVVALLFSPMQETYLSREGAGTRLGERFTPPEGAQRQQLQDGGFAYVWHDQKGVYNVKTTTDGYVYSIEWYLAEMPRPNTVEFRASLKSQYGQWLVESQGNEIAFTDLYEDGYTRWEISYGTLADLENVLQLRMWDLVEYTDETEETTAGGVNLDVLFSQYGDEFPNGLGGINIGQTLVPGDTWKPVSTAAGGNTYEYTYPNGDVFTITVADQMLITSSTYTFKSQPSSFRAVIKDYLMNKYGAYLANQVENSTQLLLQFRQADPGGGPRKCLDLNCTGELVIIKAFSLMEEVDESTQEPVDESESYVSRLVLEDLFEAEEGELPLGLGPIKLGDELNPGDVWILSKTEGGLKYYIYDEYDNDDYTEVRVDDKGFIRSIQHNFLQPSADFKKKIKGYLLGTFNSLLESHDSSDAGSITYFLQRGSGGSEPLSLAVYEWSDALAIRIFYGELK